MPIRTVEDLSIDVLDTLLNSRHHRCQSTAEYFQLLERVARQLAGILADQLPDSALNSCARDIVANIRASRPTNPRLTSTTFGSANDLVRPTSEGYYCYTCDQQSQIIRTRCQNERCTCFGEHVEDICHVCNRIFDITLHRYNAPEEITLHHWRVVPLDRWPQDLRRRGSLQQYLLECFNCRDTAFLRIRGRGTPDFSTRYNSPCDMSHLRHLWELTSIGMPGNPEAHLYICHFCSERLMLPDGSQQHEDTSPCPRKPQPGVTLRGVVRKKTSEHEPEAVRPTRFEREDVI